MFCFQNVKICVCTIKMNILLLSVASLIKKTTYSLLPIQYSNAKMKQSCLCMALLKQGSYVHIIVGFSCSFHGKFLYALFKEMLQFIHLSKPRSIMILSKQASDFLCSSKWYGSFCPYPIKAMLFMPLLLEKLCKDDVGQTK